MAVPSGIDAYIKYYSDPQLWVEGFFFGCWVFRSRLFYCLRCVRITDIRSINMGETAHPRFAASWPAIIIGALIAIAASLMLLALGSGLGFATILPGSDHAVMGPAFWVTAAIWLILTQWLSSGLGGYIAGRLRTRRPGNHAHGVLFRDTAHGLVTWAVATVVVAALIGPSVRSMITASAQAASVIAPHATNFGDSEQSSGDRRVGAYRILGNTLATGSFPIVVRIYASGVDAVKAGVSGSDMVRKAAVRAGIYSALALLIGAYTASVAAALGGRLRDRHI
jgi:hypothetical protein